MLAALALIPQQLPFIPRDLLVSGDRDEHVRISRFPLAHVIETYLFGNTR